MDLPLGCRRVVLRFGLESFRNDTDLSLYIYIWMKTKIMKVGREGGENLFSLIYTFSWVTIYPRTKILKFSSLFSFEKSHRTPLLLQFIPSIKSQDETESSSGQAQPNSSLTWACTRTKSARPTLIQPRAREGGGGWGLLVKGGGLLIKGGEVGCVS